MSLHKGGGAIGSHKHGVSGHGGTKSPRAVARANAERRRQESQAQVEREEKRLRGLTATTASEAVKRRRAK